jgi:hypothetical protein
VKNSIFVDSKSFLFWQNIGSQLCGHRKNAGKKDWNVKEKRSKKSNSEYSENSDALGGKSVFKQVFWYDCHLFLKLKCHHNYFMILFQVLHISTLFSNQSIFDHLKPAVVFFCFISLGTGWLGVVVQ